MGLGIGGLLEQLIGPPGGFIFLTLFGLLLMRRYPRAGIALTASGSVLLYISSLPVTAQVLMSGWEPNTALTEKTLMTGGALPQAIVILGAGRREDSKEFAGDTLSNFALERVRYGVWLARRTLLPVLVTGGLGDDAGVKKILSEAQMMKQVIESEYALAVRWAEAQSQTTHENAQYSAEILKAEDIDTIYLVTHAVHMKRSVTAFEKFGFNVTPAPTAFYGSSQRDLTLRHFLPSAKALNRTAMVFHEWVGLMWYGIRY